MIAANHPSLGMSPNQSGENFSRFSPIMVRPFTPVPRPSPAPSPAPPAVNQITSAPVVAQHAAPQALVHLTAPVYTEAPNPAPAVPASAAAGTTPAPAATSNTFDDFLNWLESETIFTGYPNGLVFAGGLIAVSWLFSPRKGRR